MIKTVSKVDAVIVQIAKKIFITKIGEKVETIKELASEFSMSVGTIQKAFDILESESCFELENKGHQGKFLKSKDIKKLLNRAELNELLAVMPLPKTKRYEGLATSIKKQFLDAGIKIHFAYMQGSIIRLNMVAENIYDFAIVSHLAYMNNKTKNIKKLMNLGEQSYVSSHVLIYKDKIEKIGIDENSEDQYFLTKKFIEEKKYTLVDINSDGVLNLIDSGFIDGAICSIDEIEEKDIKTFSISELKIAEKELANEAVIVINKENKVMETLIKEVLDIKKIIDIQQQVLKKEIIPIY